jgi:arginase
MSSRVSRQVRVGRGARSYAIVEAPSVLGLRPTGVEELPKTLIELGLAERLNARVAARVEPPDYDPERDAETRMLNPRAIRHYSVKLADAVGNILNNDDFPVVLGGDCSILLGNLLALRRRARYGLLFVDGHADFYQPEANVNGEVASSELAFATGRGPEVIAAPDGYRPLVRDEDVVAFAHRDAEEATHYRSQPLPQSLRSIDLGAVRRMGAEAAARQAMAHLERDELAGFWIHLDADALDDAIMPAVDYRMPDGLSWGELEAVLRRAAASAGAVGLDVTIYNPSLDPDRRAGRELVRTIANAMV